jgi:hypothetical protein
VLLGRLTTVPSNDRRDGISSMPTYPPVSVELREPSYPPESARPSHMDARRATRNPARWSHVRTPDEVKSMAVHAPTARPNARNRILLGLIREGEGVAAQVLQKFGADLNRVRQTVIQLLSVHRRQGRADAPGGIDAAAGRPS